MLLDWNAMDLLVELLILSECERVVYVRNKGADMGGCPRSIRNKWADMGGCPRYIWNIYGIDICSDACFRHDSDTCSDVCFFSDIFSDV